MRTSPHIPRIAAAHRRAGFNLMEVLIAIGVFAVGMVAVAAIFPTALTLQRNTTQDLIGRQAAQNARALIEMAQFTEDDFNGMNISSDNIHRNTADFREDEVWPLPASQRSSTLGISPYYQWAVIDRGYPSASIDRALTAVDASVYWVPFVQDPSGANPAASNPLPGEPSDMVLFLFLVRREPDLTYPRSQKPDVYYAFNPGDTARPTEPEAIPGIFRLSVGRPTNRNLKRLEVSPTDLAELPFTLSLKDVFQPGVGVLTSIGEELEVSKVEGNEIEFTTIVTSQAAVRYLWCVAPHEPGARSPFVGIETLTSVIKTP